MLLSNKILTRHEINIIVIQELVINGFNLSIMSKDWILVYPSTHCAHPGKSRTLMLVSTMISTDSWEQVDFPSGDVTAIVIKGEWGKITIFNIYNDSNNNKTINQLKLFHRTRPNVMNQVEAGVAHILWLGDFNRHHPHWDDPNDTRLFTESALKAAEILIEAVALLWLDLILPSGIPMHCHHVMKKWSCLDQVFISEHSADLVEVCDLEACFHSVKTDHLPIITPLNMSTPAAPSTSLHNFRDMDWIDFHNNLEGHLHHLEQPKRIANQEQLDKSCKELMTVLQMTIEAKVPKLELCSKSKQWWTKELMQMHHWMNILGRSSYK